MLEQEQIACHGDGHDDVNDIHEGERVAGYRGQDGEHHGGSNQ